MAKHKHGKRAKGKGKGKKKWPQPVRFINRFGISWKEWVAWPQP